MGTGEALSFCVRDAEGFLSIIAASPPPAPQDNQDIAPASKLGSIFLLRDSPQILIFKAFLRRFKGIFKAFLGCF